MATFKRICPMCGYSNRNLYLEDTNGWMECERCGSLSRDTTDLTRETKRRSFLFDDQAKRFDQEPAFATVV